MFVSLNARKAKRFAGEERMKKKTLKFWDFVYQLVCILPGLVGSMAFVIFPIVKFKSVLLEISSLVDIIWYSGLMLVLVNLGLKGVHWSVKEFLRFWRGLKK